MFSWTTFVASIVSNGALLLVTARVFPGYLADRWLAQYKGQLDREFETYRDALKRRRKQIEVELGHRVYVTKTQFDTEFNAVKDCFAALGKLGLGLNGLRPMIELSPRDPAERLPLLHRRLTDFYERYNLLVTTSESVYPFVPQDIYEQFEICTRVSWLEAEGIREDLNKALTPIGYLEGAKRTDEFNLAYFAAAKLIRHRFSQLAVVSE
jgi:hypothetical protein